MGYTPPAVTVATDDTLKGMYVAEGALKHWRYGTSAVKQIFTLGDSLEGRWSLYDTWVEHLKRKYLNEMGADPGNGFTHVGLSDTGMGWTFDANWSAAGSSDPFDRGLYLTMRHPPAGVGAHTDHARFVPLPGGDDDLVTFYWVDAGASYGNWQYSLNDGSTWVNMGQTRLNDGGLKSFTVAGPVTTAIRIRPSTNGTNVVGTGIAGVSLTSSGVTRGWRFHHNGYAGHFLADLNRTTAGDPYALFDLIVPDLIISIFSNDVPLGSTGAVFKARYTNMISQIRGSNPDTNFILVCPPEQDPAQRSASLQADHRAATVELAEEQGVAVLDLCEAWGGSYDAHVALGYMDADGIHPDNDGHSDIAWRLGRMIDIFS